MMKNNGPGKTRIELFGTDDEIELKFNCEECNCGRATENAPQCSRRGTLKCGGCECKEGFSGKQYLRLIKYI